MQTAVAHGGRGIARIGTGVAELDSLTSGGWPRGRFTLVVGGPGTGKTVLALHAVAALAASHRGAVFVAFEETAAQLRENTATFRWGGAVEGGGFEILDAHLPPSARPSGAFDLSGLLGILGARVEATGAELVVFDGLDALLWMLGDPALARAELLRIRDWLSARHLTAIVTAKADRDGHTTGYDFLEYLADCVVVLDQRLHRLTSHRSLRVAKFRGSPHSADEVPFTITSSGVTLSSVAALPVHPAFGTERVSSGVTELDAMLGGGFFRGSSVLISGAPGTSKTILASAAVAAACARGERALLVSFDEASATIVHHVRSVGLELAPFVADGRLVCLALRAGHASPAVHAATIVRAMEAHDAHLVAIDPISALAAGARHPFEAESARHAAQSVVDFARSRCTTLVGTALVDEAWSGVGGVEGTPVGLSTIADAWLHLTYVNQQGERNRALSIVKVRGTSHSNQVRELILSAEGVHLAEVYAASGEVLMGTMRWQKEREMAAAARARDEALSREQRELEIAIAKTEQQAHTLASELELRRVELSRLATARAQAERDHAEWVTALRERRVRGEDGEDGEG